MYYCAQNYLKSLFDGWFLLGLLQTNCCFLFKIVHFKFSWNNGPVFAWVPFARFRLYEQNSTQSTAVYFRSHTRLFTTLCYGIETFRSIVKLDSTFFLTWCFGLKLKIYSESLPLIWTKFCHSRWWRGCSLFLQFQLVHRDFVRYSLKANHKIKLVIFFLVQMRRAYSIEDPKMSVRSGSGHFIENIADVTQNVIEEHSRSISAPSQFIQLPRIEGSISQSTQNICQIGDITRSLFFRQYHLQKCTVCCGFCIGDIVGLVSSLTTRQNMEPCFQDFQVD